MGGIGKTSLVRQVYTDDDVMKFFDIRIWVCVSMEFNVVSLTKQMLESATDDKSDYENFNLLQTKIKEKLQTKKFLLVIDDAWNDSERGDWERLCAPLRHGQVGSRILLTTRSRSVVKMVSTVMGGAMDTLDLKGLSNDECRSLLYHYAFHNERPGAHPWLTRIADKIIEKLHGIPLLAKTIGGVLYDKLELATQRVLEYKLVEDHWRRVLEDGVWEVKQNSKDDFIPALRLRYLVLSARLKRCFGYCSLFPQDYEFDKKSLVDIWVAAGLIRPEESEEGLEVDIASQCFDTMYSKSLFDRHPRRENYYVMHDMLHGLACHVSRYECCRIMHDQPSNIPETVRHLSITSTTAELLELTNMVSKLRHMRTLFIDIEYKGQAQKLHDFIQKACTSPRSLRVLVIDLKGTKSSDWWLSSVGNMVNLRLLDLSRCGISTLPESLCRMLCRFYFLQVLNLKYDNDLPPIRDMNKLTNLKRLCGIDFSSIFEVGKLTSLQELSIYCVGTKHGHKIDELKDMNDLHELGIHCLWNVRSIEEAKGANLQRKKKLRSLKLAWDGPEPMNFDPDHDQQVLTVLNPPPGIRKVILDCYKGGKSAPWMNPQSLYYLESLDLKSCSGWEELPALWELSHLKHLGLVDMDSVIKFGPQSSIRVDQAFPSLEQLLIRNLPRWQEWNGTDNYVWFPHLTDVEIENCPKLMKFPCMPSSLKKFHLKNVGLSSLSESCTKTSGELQQLLSLKSLVIYECPTFQRILPIGDEAGSLLPSSLTELRIDVHEGDLGRYLRGLTRLSKLKLKYCRGMTTLPSAEELHHLTALKELHLSKCDDLAFAGGLHAITSLKTLQIKDCPNLLAYVIDLSSCAKNKLENLLPPLLTRLQIWTSDVSQESLSQCLQCRTLLSKLEGWNCLNLSSLPMKIIIKADMNCRKSVSKVLKVAASIGGVDSVAAEEHKMVVIGDGVDVIELISTLRKKVGYADIISVGR